MTRDEYLAFVDHHASLPQNLQAADAPQRPYYRHFEPRPHSAILDFGAYCGANLFHYADLGHRVVGIEAAGQFVNRYKQLARDRPGDHIMFCGLAEEYAPGEKFDHVICGEVLEFVPDPEAVTAAAYNALVPGGTAFFACFGIQRPTHTRLVTPIDLASWLYHAGFETIESTEDEPYVICEATK